MLDTVRRFTTDIAKAGQSFLGAGKAFQSAYRGATGQDKPTAHLVVRPK